MSEDVSYAEVDEQFTVPADLPPLPGEDYVPFPDEEYERAGDERGDWR